MLLHGDKCGTLLRLHLPRSVYYEPRAGRHFDVCSQWAKSSAALEETAHHTRLDRPRQPIIENVTDKDDR